MPMWKLPRAISHYYYHWLVLRLRRACSMYACSWTGAGVPRDLRRNTHVHCYPGDTYGPGRLLASARLHHKWVLHRATGGLLCLLAPILTTLSFQRAVECLAILFHIREILGFSPSQKPATLTKVLRGFAQSFQAKAGIVHYITSRPLPYHFNFSVY